MEQINKQQALLNEATEKKIDSLLAQMTIDEKIGQLQQVSPSIFGTFEMTMDEIIEKMVDGEMTVEEFISLPRDFHEQEIREGKLGSMGGVSSADKANELQRIAVEESRLGIPMLFGLDVIHGFRTIFPIPLAEACSWEPELLKESARIAAKEAASAGVHWTFAPMVDIGRDPRWGRVSEGAGEDTYLGSVMAAARVQGFQGDDLSDPERLLACPKHYAAYGAAVGGRDYNTVDMSLQQLHDLYLPPFKAAVKAGAGSIMCAFNDLNGVPCSANGYLMDTVLREQFGFEGLVVSDANSVAECVAHGHAKDKKDAARNSLLAGLDVDMSDGTYRSNLHTLLEEGAIPMDKLNQAVRRVLRIKFSMGLFDNPYRTSTEKEQQTLLAQEHLAEARETARRSMVLLKNDNQLLPLNKKLEKIAVVGPLADDADGMHGAWAISVHAEDTTTILSGIRSAVGQQSEIIHAKGCDIVGDDTSGFAEAISAAEKADVVIAVVGESSDMSGEASSRIELGLPGVQLELLKELKKTGKPVVLVLVNGRPLSIAWESKELPAILEAWQLGTEAGNAVADVLFGDYNPSGKLVATFPYSVGQVPIYYNHPNTGRPAGKIKFTSKYIDGPCEPLYPFGYGLSYTTFEYGDLKVSETCVKKDAVVSVEVKLTNIGDVFGEEVVQLYVADPVASRVRPVKELKGFLKVGLAPKETRTLAFQLDASTLGFHDENLVYKVESGMYKIWVGPNSTSGLAAEFEVK